MGRKSIPDMTYEELEKEHQKNTFAKQRLANQSEKETDSKIQLELTRQILSLARRNERLVKQQLVLMKGQLYEISKPKPEPKPEPQTKAKKVQPKKAN
ncbi:hypothetical protein [Microcoleus sp. S13_B4]|uniref:hypothetical protein n=1 Tax=Microcoleus sp. S13_B4 TaxID=3055408 RepID=UPI002FCF30E6